MQWPMFMEILRGYWSLDWLHIILRKGPTLKIADLELSQMFRRECGRYLSAWGGAEIVQVAEALEYACLHFAHFFQADGNFRRPLCHRFGDCKT